MSDKQRKASTRASEPRVGIFWLLDRRLLFDTTPLSQAEHYGDFKIHPGDHVSVWERFRLARIVPPEMEYEEPPRGRVMFNTKTHQYSLLADRCILRQKKIVAEIKREMHLPRNTHVGTDYHYRCLTCLQWSTF